MTELNNVPENKVPQQVKIFMLAGLAKITIEKQQDGKWTIKGE